MLSVDTVIHSSCVDCGNTQIAKVNQCDCGCAELVKLGDFVLIHSQGEMVCGVVTGFKVNRCNNMAMVTIEPDDLDHDTEYFTEEISEILL